MLVETPPILWNAQDDDTGLPAALTSVALCESGIVYKTFGGNETCHVLATAGNSKFINLWKTSFLDMNTINTNNTAKNIFQSSLPPNATSAGTLNSSAGAHVSLAMSTKVEYLCSLSRHDGPVNSVQFSPDGLHLASGGLDGTLIIWSVPVNKRANGNGRHYWSTVTNENELIVRILSRCANDGINDLSWSADSKRILLGSIDHSVICCEDESYDLNHNAAQTSSSVSLSSSVSEIASEWKIVYTDKHKNYVQGVSYDPLGVYLASMSADRTVRILQRRQQKPRKLGASQTAVASLTSQYLLSFGKFDKDLKARQIKYRKAGTQSSSTDNSKQPCFLYAHDDVLKSFFRRLAWTTDGAFLVTPAALWQNTIPEPSSPSCGSNVAFENSNNSKKQAVSGSAVLQYATLLFARHRYEEPYRVLAGLDKPSLAVCPNPIFFQLPEEDESECNDKENKSPSKRKEERGSLPYRSVFAVLTSDSVLIYDTYHLKPLSIIRGIHFANIVHAAWSSDGHNLIVCSTDCYVSIIRFASGELGHVYTKPAAAPSLLIVDTSESQVLDNAPTHVTPDVTVETEKHLTVKIQQQPKKISFSLPPCESGPAHIIEGPAAKRQKTRITPILVATISDGSNARLKRPLPEAPTEAVDKMTLNTPDTNVHFNETHINKKPKKRIQPILLAVADSVENNLV